MTPAATKAARPPAARKPVPDVDDYSVPGLLAYVEHWAGDTLKETVTRDMVRYLSDPILAATIPKTTITFREDAVRKARALLDPVVAVDDLLGSDPVQSDGWSKTNDIWEPADPQNPGRLRLAHAALKKAGWWKDQYQADRVEAIGALLVPYLSEVRPVLAEKKPLEEKRRAWEASTTRALTRKRIEALRELERGAALDGHPITILNDKDRPVPLTAKERDRLAALEGAFWADAKVRAREAYREIAAERARAGLPPGPKGPGPTDIGEFVGMGKGEGARSRVNHLIQQGTLPAEPTATLDYAIEHGPDAQRYYRVWMGVEKAALAIRDEAAIRFLTHRKGGHGRSQADLERWLGGDRPDGQGITSCHTNTLAKRA